MREAGIHRIEVHVAAACVRQSERGLEMLALHRASSRSLFPGLWEGVGGQVGPGESLVHAVTRHLHEEASLSGQVICPVDTYVIDPGPTSGASELIPGVRFLVSLPSGVQPQIDPRQHQGWRWVPVDQLAAVAWIPGMLEQLRHAVSLFRTLGLSN